MTDQPKRLKAPPGYCTYMCGRTADGTRRTTGEACTTCVYCRTRYAYNKQVARMRNALNHHDRARALYARVRLEDLLANPPTIPDEEIPR